MCTFWYAQIASQVHSGLTDSSDDDDDSDGDDRMQAKRNLFGSDTEEYDNDSDSEACNMLLSK